MRHDQQAKAAHWLTNNSNTWLVLVNHNAYTMNASQHSNFHSDLLRFSLVHVKNSKFYEFHFDFIHLVYASFWFMPTQQCALDSKM